MPDILLDFRLFRYALVSAEYRSFRRAATALHTQPSTVSRGVRSLEHRIGAELFERGHFGIRPTPAGDRFLQEAALGFDHLERAMQRIGAAQRGEHGELTVASSVPFRMIGESLERFRQNSPGVALEFVEETCSGGAMLVRQHKAEVAFLSDLRANGGTRSRYMRDESLMAVLPSSHRLARAPAVTLEDLRAERLILGAGGLGPTIAAYLQRQMDDRPDPRLLRAGQCDLISMIGRGFGASIAIGEPSHQPGSDRIAVVPLAGRHAIPIHAVWLPTTANPALRILLKLIGKGSQNTQRHSTT